MLLCIGYPESIPNNIPKLNRNIIVHKEKYVSLGDTEIQEAYEDKYGDFDEDPEKYFMKAYIEVIGYRKLLEDAKKRNRVLFDRLGIKS